MTKEIFFVVCGSLTEFREFSNKKQKENQDYQYDYRYVYDRKTLLGHNNPHGCFYGSWRQRQDIQEILMDLIVRTTDGSNWKLKELLEEISKSS